MVELDWDLKVMSSSTAKGLDELSLLDLIAKRRDDLGQESVYD